MMETVSLTTITPAPANSGLFGIQSVDVSQPLFADIFSGLFADQPPLTMEQAQESIKASQALALKPVFEPLSEPETVPAVIAIPLALTPGFTQPVLKDFLGDMAIESSEQPIESALPYEDIQQWGAPFAKGSTEREQSLKDGRLSQTAAEAYEQPVIKRQRANKTILNSTQQKPIPELLNSGENREQPVEIKRVDERLMPLQKEPVMRVPLAAFDSDKINGNNNVQNNLGIDSAIFGSESDALSIKGQHLIPLATMERFDSSQSQPLMQTVLSSVKESLPSLEIQGKAEAAKSSHAHESMDRMTLANPVPKLGQRVLQMVSRGESSIEIRLDPPELGKLTLSLSLDRDSLNLQITTSNSAVRDLLMSHDGRLRQALTEQGMSLGNLAVNVQSEQQHHNHQAAASDIDPLGLGVLADGTEVDQSFIPGALLFQAQGGRLLDQFI